MFQLWQTLDWKQRVATFLAGAITVLGALQVGGALFEPGLVNTAATAVLPGSVEQAVGITAPSTTVPPLTVPAQVAIASQGAGITEAAGKSSAPAPIVAAPTTTVPPTAPPTTTPVVNEPPTTAPVFAASCIQTTAEWNNIVAEYQNELAKLAGEAYEEKQEEFDGKKKAWRSRLAACGVSI